MVQQPDNRMAKTYNKAELNRLRGRVKAKLTIITKFDEKDKELCEKTKVEWESKLRHISELKQELKRLFELYGELKLDEKEEFECDEIFMELDSICDTLEVNIKYFLTGFTDKTDKSKTEDFSANNSLKFDFAAKLPTIPLPKFSGKIEEFANFKGQFQSMISANENISETQKLFYLKAALQGEAKMLETSEDTFKSLFSALEARYENKRAIVDLHIQEILGLEKINFENSKLLRNLSDKVKKNLRGLKVLNLECNDLSNAIITNIVLQKLDKDSRKAYELSVATKEIPSLHELLQFIDNRSNVLDQLNTSISNKNVKGFQNHMSKPRNLFINADKNIKLCFMCNEQHSLFKCNQFNNLNISQRLEFVKNHKLCRNCLRQHKSDCRSTFKCSVCFKRHNTLLHYEKDKNGSKSVPSNVNVNNSFSAIEESSYKQEASLASTLLAQKSGILCTVLMYVTNASGRKVKSRGILDSVSTVNCISREAAEFLELKKEESNIFISGINGKESFVKKSVTATISNEKGDYTKTTTFLILPKITGLTPMRRLDVSRLDFPSGIELADSEFFIPNKIHALIGCEFFFELLKPGKFKSKDNSLFLQNTVFGFVVSGTINNVKVNFFAGLTSEKENLNRTIQRFFEIESFPGDAGDDKNVSVEELYCEEYFIKTTKRDDSGRYIVKLPIRENRSSCLGNSRDVAEKRLNQLWKKLSENEDMASQYKCFMDEYLHLGHMEREIECPSNTDNGYYIPHHAVLRPDSVSTPLRVVFDASAKTNEGSSLNSILFNGGIVQQDLFSIALRFRKHQYAFSADIKKMYRQILVDPEDRELQKILWKTDPFGPVETYHLKTVTYGTKCAPFLATRTLRALADDELKDYSDACEVVRNDFYVDDVLSGSESLDQAKFLQSNLIKVLQRGGMELHKWVSNHPELILGDTHHEYSFTS
ncbi:uncharacterized protein LOC129218718 [Uloborus diversus]|uniref:uncharacterized protein LOC129218718 n=1 Tax=Uloborus diversus TaxID=327109 RepID=UPI002409A7B7|nr:uncharacterized protein LOC129218718 [Uloborus diversus]